MNVRRTMSIMVLCSVFTSARSVEESGKKPANSSMDDRPPAFKPEGMPVSEVLKLSGSFIDASPTGQITKQHLVSRNFVLPSAADPKRQISAMDHLTGFKPDSGLGNCPLDSEADGCKFTEDSSTSMEGETEEGEEVEEDVRQEEFHTVYGSLDSKSDSDTDRTRYRLKVKLTRLDIADAKRRANYERALQFDCKKLSSSDGEVSEGTPQSAEMTEICDVSKLASSKLSEDSSVTYRMGHGYVTIKEHVIYHQDDAVDSYKDAFTLEEEDQLDSSD